MGRAVLARAAVGVILAAGSMVLLIEERRYARTPDAKLASIRELVSECQYAEAESLGVRFLETSEPNPGSDATARAEILDQLVAIMMSQAKAQSTRTQAYAESSLAVRERAFGPESPQLLTSLVNLAWLRQTQGKYSRARSLYARAERILRLSRVPSSPPATRLYRGLGILHYYTGENDSALALLNRALEMTVQLEGPQSPAFARNLKDIAVLHEKMGDFTGALAFADSARGILEKAHGPDHCDVASALLVMSGNHQRLGNYKLAREEAERALHIQTAVFGPQHPLVAETAHKLGQIAALMGDFHEAKQQYERAVVIWVSSVLGPRNRDAGKSLAGVLDRFAAVSAQGERSPYQYEYEFLRRELGVDITGLFAQSTSPERRGDLLKQAMDNWTEVFGPPPDGVQEAIGHFAEMLAASGSYEGSCALYEVAISLFEKATGDRNHPAVADACSNMAHALEHSGDLAGAAKLYERAMSIRVQVGGRDHPWVVESLTDLARLAALRGDTSQAMRMALEAERSRRAHLLATVRSLPERQALRYASSLPSGLDIALSVVASHPDSVRRVWDAVVRSRSMLLDESAGRHRRLWDEGDPQIRARREKYLAACRQLSTLRVEGISADRPELYSDLLRQAKSRVEQTELDLNHSSPDFHELQEARNLGLDAVQRALPDSSALLSFWRFERTLFEDSTAARRLGAKGRHNKPRSGDRATGPCYAAFVLRAGSTRIEMTTIGRADEIERLVASWRSRVSQPEYGGMQRYAETDYRLVADSLRHRIWDPIAPHLGGVRRVFIVPDATLNLVNFDALPVADGRYLIEVGPILHNLSTERDLVPRSVGGTGRGLLALGDPSYDGSSRAARRLGGGRLRGFSNVLFRVSGLVRTDRQSDLGAGRRHVSGWRGCEGLDALRFSRLWQTLREVEEVAAIWGQGAASTPIRAEARTDTSAEVETLLGDAASEANFKRTAPGRQVLHLATHAFFLDKPCAAAAERAISRDGLPERAPTAVGENPFLLSGLALAGANPGDSDGGEEDGILTAEEVATLDLRGVEWAVLSGCESGRGEIQTGEGVFGLRRAFQIAGARTVICSLWQVGDESTRAWMRSLYEQRRVRKRTTAEAVRGASLGILRERRARNLSTHPFEWASFVAVGDLK